jgi:hypothetical protein
MALIAAGSASVHADETVRSKIEDHLRAYLVLADCSASLLPCYHLDYVAERGAPSATCGAPNRVSDLPYRAPEIDDAVYEVMNQEMQEGLRIHVVSNALSFLARPGPDTYCSPGCEAKFHRLFKEVPFIWEGLIEKAAERIGCEDGPAVRKTPVVSRASVREVLEAMEEGILSPAGNRWLGLPALRGIPGCDPNLAVAIARVQRGWGSIPEAEEVEAELERMGVSLFP